MNIPWLKRSLRRGLCFILALLTPIVLILNNASIGKATDSVESLLQQSRQLYESGKIDRAQQILQQITTQSEGDRLTVAIALSNMALIASNQGDWPSANRAIEQSIQELQTITPSSKKTEILAKVLNVQGRLQLSQGHSSEALTTWQKSTNLYHEINHIEGEVQSKLNQAQALRAMGLYQRAFDEIYKPLQVQLNNQPDSVTKSQGLRSLGEAIGLIGKLEDAEKIIQDGITIAQRLNTPAEVAASQLTLANLTAAKVREARSANPANLEDKQVQLEIQKALDLYEKVAQLQSPNQLQAKLNRLSLLVDSDRDSDAKSFAKSLYPEILNLPPDRPSIEARINFANSLLHLEKDAIEPKAIVAILTPAVDQSRLLNDNRLLANVLGTLGRAQENQQQYPAAQTSTQQALLFANSSNATEQIYQWLAQLGRLQEHQGDRAGATQSYTQAVNILSTLRRDLLGVNAASQLVNPETLEPVHRQLVNLLLPTDGSIPNPETLKSARNVIESLQLEEINNYLRADCLQSKVDIDKIEVAQKTAIIYPIILPGRIVSIVSTTGQDPILSSAIKIDEKTVNATVQEFQNELRNRTSSKYQESAKLLYEWLIRPIEPLLKQQQVETLVFVLDGSLRTIPMAALFDGEEFLIQKYSVANTPGLKLTSPKPLQEKKISGIAFGLTEAKTVPLPNGNSLNFSALSFVDTELQDLQQEISPSTVIMDQNFTIEKFKSKLQKSTSPIVHLATHGQFSSNREQTFLLATDGVIKIGDLENALKREGSDKAIELLVLSACDTAIGDSRAPLGLAGIALKSGARSTVASLWKVNDNATSLLMKQFYKQVATRQVTKAIALQQAQRSLLADPSREFIHPYFWAPFILVGNWL